MQPRKERRPKASARKVLEDGRVDAPSDVHVECADVSGIPSEADTVSFGDGPFHNLSPCQKDLIPCKIRVYVPRWS